jgi:mono/diheme cytochrome c family protein
MSAKLIRTVGILFVLVTILSMLAACGGSQATTPAAEGSEAGGEEVAKPSNPGGAGAAVDLTGDVAAGATIFVDKCKECHGDEGKIGIDNPGGVEAVPSLNPIDSTMVSTDYKTFATNIDLFIEHGSTPEGDNPAKVMTAFGDEGKLTPQQIADVIAYVISLNK